MSVRAPRRLAALLVAPAMLAAGAALVGPGQAAAEDGPGYEGSAFALRAQVGLGGSSTVDETLPSLVTYPEGGSQSLLELPGELADVIGVEVLKATSEVNDDVLASGARTVGLAVLGNILTADVIQAQCVADGGEVTGSSQIADLSLAGTKLEVGTGENQAIEIPEALSSFLSGGIWIDERTKNADGELRVRALRVNLVVAPQALEEALRAVSAAVRAAAEQVKVALEQATGLTLDEMLGRGAQGGEAGRADAGSTDADAKAQNGATQNSGGAQAAQLRTQAAAPAAAEAAVADRAAGESAAEAQAATSESSAAVEDAAAVEATAGATQKSDGAAIDRSAAATEVAAEQAANSAAAERAERGAKSGATQADGAAQAATATEVAPSATEVALQERQEVAREAASARESERAAAAPAKKADGAVLAAPDRASAAQVDSDVLGAVGIDLVVSQVTCKGAVLGVQKPVETDELPSTGGDGNTSRNLALAGLGLLTVGTASVLVARRRHAVV